MALFSVISNYWGNLDVQHFIQETFYNNEHGSNKVWESGSSLIRMKSKALTIHWLSVEMSLRGDRWQTTRVSPKSSRVTFCPKKNSWTRNFSGFQNASLLQFLFEIGECRGSSTGLLNVSWGYRRKSEAEWPSGLWSMETQGSKPGLPLAKMSYKSWMWVKG